MNTIDPGKDRQPLGEGIYLEGYGRTPSGKTVAVARFTGRWDDDVSLPIFWQQQDGLWERWLAEAKRVVIEQAPNEQINGRRLAFLRLGIPPILAIHAADNTDDQPEEIEQKLPRVKAMIIALGSEESRRGKSMLAAVVAKKTGAKVINADKFSLVNSVSYQKSLESTSGEAEVEEMVEVMRRGISETGEADGWTVRDFLNNLWKQWMTNDKDELFVVDLPGMGKKEGVNVRLANGFDALRLAMPCIYVYREDDEGRPIDRDEEVEPEVIGQYWQQYEAYQEMAIEAGKEQATLLRLLVEKRERELTGSS